MSLQQKFPTKGDQRKADILQVIIFQTMLGTVFIHTYTI
jgi:hypothetical protein